jgi:putative ABC transport system ATP-binding protein
VIDVQNLTKRYAKGAVVTEALGGVCFRVEKGEFVAIMGASGSGKTTLMHILGGLDRPTSGTYRLDGLDMAQATDDELSGIRNRKIGFVFQQFYLLDRADALKNVMLPLIYADGAGDDDARAGQALAAVGLGTRTRHRPAELSGGEQQRVAIARALVTNPVLILADEPTGNLDVRNGLEVLAIFQRLHREGRTLVMITHDAAVAEHASRRIVLQDGRITGDQPVASPRDAHAELARMTANAPGMPAGDQGTAANAAGMAVNAPGSGPQ